MPDAGDRYPTDPSDPARAFAEQIAELRRQISQLQQRSLFSAGASAAVRDPVSDVVRMRVGKQTDGTYGVWFFDVTGAVVLKLNELGQRMYDAAGDERALIGKIGALYGVRVLDALGNTHLEIDDEGVHNPWLAHPWRAQITPQQQSTANTAFTTLWSSTVGYITHLGVETTAAWITDAGTTGEIRLASAVGGATSAVALAAGTSGSQQFKWLHDATLSTGPVSFRLQARVTGGAGQVRLDQPLSGLIMIDPVGCDADGIP